MSIDPQTRPADDPGEHAPGPADVETGATPAPTPEQLIAASRDGSQDGAVSAQPADTEPADLDDAAARVRWDAATDGGA